MSQDNDDLRFDIGKPFSINRYIISSKIFSIKDMLHKVRLTMADGIELKLKTLNLKTMKFITGCITLDAVLKIFTWLKRAI